MTEKQIIEEVRTEVCTLCGGRGQEQVYGGLVPSCVRTCRACQGCGYVVTSRKKTTKAEPGKAARREVTPIDSRP